MIATVGNFEAILGVIITEMKKACERKRFECLDMGFPGHPPLGREGWPGACQLGLRVVGEIGFELGDALLGVIVLDLFLGLTNPLDDAHEAPDLP